MKINVAEKYLANITNKHFLESIDSISEFTEKEKLMWTFTLWLLKDNYPKEIYDTEEDALYLSGYYKVFMKAGWAETFSLEEWESYLLSR